MASVRPCLALPALLAGRLASAVLAGPPKGKPVKPEPEELAKMTRGPKTDWYSRFSPKGDYLVWGATQRGHDHDLADYENYLWKVGGPPEKAARLTWHSGNDRWPDIFLD